ncbi:hypothetical protein ANCDUO_10422 [Ancylostoma duodenale]|uniref:ISXO2-like transposase domain-containing protein n=1 Tax=Ancylostoma duodenale TaxID=51022 RepID=A0A0C2CRC6_9BILA|nr:hypothetical protein ANCDUO_10422 [Ancylostoma duodenale]
MSHWTIWKYKAFDSCEEGVVLRQDSLPTGEIFALSYSWTYNMDLVGDKEYELGIDHSTVLQWEQYFRDLCREYFLRNRSVLGGIGHVVEIDETCVTKRKYNGGRWVQRHQWLFGGYEKRKEDLSLFK